MKSTASEPALVNFVHDKFDVWLSYVRLNDSLDRPTRSMRLLQTERMSEDRLRAKLRSTNKLSNNCKFSSVA